MKERPGHTAPSMPTALAASWEHQGTPNDIRLAEATKRVGNRISELVSFVRVSLKTNPHLASLLAVMSGADFDQELLEANARIMIDDPVAMDLFIQIERIIAERTPVFVRQDLAELQSMINQLPKKG